MDELKRVEIELTVGQVDPELLELLTGESGAARRGHGLEIHSKIKRTWWQRLRRRPQRWQTIWIPNAEITEVDDGRGDSGPGAIV